MIGDLLRDEQMLSQVLRRKLLRSMIRAAGIISDSGRGKYVGAEELRAATALLRLAPRVMLAPPAVDNHPFNNPEWWTVEKLIQLEQLSDYDSREDAARVWRTCFDKNGPREGLFQSRQEAAEYGRRRFDQMQPGCDENGENRENDENEENEENDDNRENDQNRENRENEEVYHVP